MTLPEIGYHQALAELERRRIPPKLEFLLSTADRRRYSIAYGGRGSAKSWTFAKSLVLIAAGIIQIPKWKKGVRIVCARETMKSMKDSVHALLKDQIYRMGLDGLFEITETSIVRKDEGGRDISRFLFVGLRHNVQEIKSLEGADILWIEEANLVSSASWTVVIPTIRKEGSEIWVSFNPELDTDDTFVRFVVNTPPDAHVVKINYDDNPWFPEVLKKESDHLKSVNPVLWQNVYGGDCKSAVEGAIYASEIASAEAEGRITQVPHERGSPVYTFWDLGFADMVCIWMIQAVGFQYRVIDFVSGSGYALDYYLSELRQRKDRQGHPYIYGIHYLPWDGASKGLGTGKSIKDLIQAAGMEVKVVPKLPVTDGINAARMVFNKLYFDRERTQDGLQALRRYRWKFNSDNQLMRDPLHDDNSHAADALRTFAVAIRPPEKQQPISTSKRQVQTGWMAN